MEVLNTNLKPVILGELTGRRETLTFAQTDTVLQYTILARETDNDTLIPYVKGGSTKGNGVPRWILLHEASRTGAGTLPVDVGIAKFDLNGLVIHADGDGHEIDGVVVDLLKEAGITVADVADFGKIDNQ